MVVFICHSTCVIFKELEASDVDMAKLRLVDAEWPRSHAFNLKNCLAYFVTTSALPTLLY